MSAGAVRGSQASGKDCTIALLRAELLQRPKLGHELGYSGKLDGIVVSSQLCTAIQFSS